ncbi:MAG: hypothetical protein WC004_00120 [Candidatus Absconditabacterales bacterium]
MKKTLLNIKTHQFLATPYAQETLGSSIQKQIAEAFSIHPKLQPIVSLSEKSKDLLRSYRESSDKNTKTCHALERKQNQLALETYEVIGSLLVEQEVIQLADEVIRAAKKHYIDEIKKIFIITNNKDIATYKYLARVVDLHSRATTAIDISLGASGYNMTIEHLIKNKKIPNIRTKYKIHESTNDIEKIHSLTKKAESNPQLISDIQLIFAELYKVYVGIFDSKLGIE